MLGLIARIAFYLMSSVAFQPFQLDEARARLRKMSDADLLRFGRAAASLCKPDGNFGQPPRKVFVEQLQEARAEWRRRHPKEEHNDENECRSDCAC
jgi:hypothetical protein